MFTYVKRMFHVFQCIIFVFYIYVTVKSNQSLVSLVTRTDKYKTQKKLNVLWIELAAYHS